MRTHLPNLPIVAWALIGLPALIVCHSLVMTIVPWVLNAAVPQAVRTVLSVI
jgi:hypothetical protein